MTRRRKVDNPLALAVLVLTAERPMHPYEMAQVLRERGKHTSINIKRGSLYTVVRSLQRHGLIEATGTFRQGRRPERTVYALTDAGRAETRDWLRELIAVPEKEFARWRSSSCSPTGYGGWGSSWPWLGLAGLAVALATRTFRSYQRAV